MLRVRNAIHLYSLHVAQRAIRCWIIALASYLYYYIVLFCSELCTKTRPYFTLYFIQQLVGYHGSSAIHHHLCSSPTYVSPYGTSLTINSVPVPILWYLHPVSHLCHGHSYSECQCNHEPHHGCHLYHLSYPHYCGLQPELQWHGGGCYDIIVAAIPLIVGLVNTFYPHGQGGKL